MVQFLFSFLALSLFYPFSFLALSLLTHRSHGTSFHCSRTSVYLCTPESYRMYILVPILYSTSAFSSIHDLILILSDINIPRHLFLADYQWLVSSFFAILMAIIVSLNIFARYVPTPFLIGITSMHFTPLFDVTSIWTLCHNTSQCSFICLCGSLTQCVIIREPHSSQWIPMITNDFKA